MHFWNALVLWISQNCSSIGETKLMVHTDIGADGHSKYLEAGLKEKKSFSFPNLRSCLTETSLRHHIYGCSEWMSFSRH